MRLVHPAPSSLAVLVGTPSSFLLREPNAERWRCLCAAGVVLHPSTSSLSRFAGWTGPPAGNIGMKVKMAIGGEATPLTVRIRGLRARST